MSVAAISCSNIVKRYDANPVLEGVNLDVSAGSITAILGASGSGKSTLLRIIMGFIAPDSGEVAVAGLVVSQSERIVVPAERRNIGYVAQEGALFPHLNVAQNIAFGLPRSERRSSPRINELLQLVGMSKDFAKRHPEQLSGGEQRRIALARAMAPRPQAILLDEPFTGLDASLRAETRAAVVNALASTETTALLVTHDPAEALSLGQQVALLRDGCLVQVDKPAVVYQTPVDLQAARFVGDAVVVVGEAEGDMVSCILGRLPLHQEARGKVQVLIRPEQIHIADNTNVQATVTESVFYGRQTVLSLAVPDVGGVEITAGIPAQEAPGVGTKVGIVVQGKVVAYPQDAETDA